VQAPARAVDASALEPAELPADAVEVARVLGAWGVKGALKLKPLSADPQALFSSRRWFLAPPEVDGGMPRPAPPGLPQRPTRVRVRETRSQADAIVATLDEVTDRDLAQALAGWRVLVPRTSFPTPGADEFYWVDLIGLAVRNRQGLELGTVVGLIETGPHCVLRVQPPAAVGLKPAEVLIPFVAAYVDAVDLPGRRIAVDWAADD
jgi:16S rRNA processing protein RimM